MRARRPARPHAIGIALLAALALGAAACGSPPARPTPPAADETVDAPPGPLVVGAAKTVITPSGSVRLAGAALGRKSTSVHDDLYARCLVVGNGRRTLGLVALDLLGFFRPDVEVARAGARGVVDHLVVAATHDHSGPDVLGYWGPSFFGLFPIRSGRDERYVGTLDARIDECVRAAKASATPAALRLTRAMVRGFSENIRRPGFKDDELTVAEMRATASGRTIAVLYDFAAHPEIFLEDTVVTADFPALVDADVERRLGGEAIFVNGAIGALVTVDLGADTIGLASAARRPTFADGARVSRRLSDAIVGALRATEVEIASAPLTIHRRVFDLPVTNWRFRLARRLGVLRRGPAGGRVRTEVDVIDLGPVEMVTVPGEVSPAIGLAIKARMRRPFRFLVGLGNDELGYILAADEYHDARYGYERTMSIGPGAARVEDEALAMLGER